MAVGNIPIYFGQTGGTSSFTYSFGSCKAKNNKLEFIHTDTWLSVSKDDTLINLTAGANGDPERKTDVEIYLNNKHCGDFNITQDGINCSCTDETFNAEGVAAFNKDAHPNAVLGSYTASTDCITNVEVINSSTMPEWLTSVSVNTSDKTITGNISANTSSEAREPVTINLRGTLKPSGTCDRSVTVNQNGTGCQCGDNTFNAEGVATFDKDAHPNAILGRYTASTDCVSDVVVISVKVKNEDTTPEWLTYVDINTNDKTITGNISQNQSIEARKTAVITLEATLNDEQTTCPKYIEVNQNGIGCNCGYIQQVNINTHIPPEGGEAGLVLGSMTVTDGQCSVTFTSSTANLYVGTASTETNNALNIVLTQKGPSNIDPDEDTPAVSYTITALVNGTKCDDYTVIQDGTIYCDCEHIKFNPEDVHTKLPPEKVDGIFLLSADTKGCGEIIFACESDMFENKQLDVRQEGNVYYVYANILKPSYGTPLPRYGEVSATYDLNGQQDASDCRVEIRFQQTNEYCGCQYDFGVMTKYYTENPKYLIRPYYFDESPYTHIDDSTPFTIPPIFYDYCNEGDHQKWRQEDEYCDLTEKNVIASLHDQTWHGIPSCLSFWVTVDEECDWLSIIDQQVNIGEYILQFAKIKNNIGNEDRETTITIHRYTNDEGECEPTEIKVLQRYDKVTTCEELMNELNGYYDDEFNPPNNIHESISYIEIGSIYVPYGKLIIDYDEEKLSLSDIYCDGSWENANYLTAYFKLKDSVSRDEDVYTDISLKIRLSNEVECPIYSYSVKWNKKSTPVVRPCNCDNIKLSYYGNVIIPYNWGTSCTYCERFGYNNASHPSECGEISGYTSDENGNEVDPTTYDWFTITGYGDAYGCGNFYSHDDYAVYVKLNYIPNEDKIGYFKPFLVKNGEKVFEDCGNAVSIRYIANCDYVDCSKNNGNIYEALGTDHIETTFEATTADIGATFNIGYIDIGIKDQCYTDAGIECCVKGHIDSTHSYFKELKADLKLINGTYRIEYSFKFDNAPNQSETIPLVIDVVIGGTAQYGNIVIDLVYTRTQ